MIWLIVVVVVVVLCLLGSGDDDSNNYANDPVIYDEDLDRFFGDD